MRFYSVIRSEPTFDTKQTDAFYNWSARRDQYVAEANVYAAKSALDSGTGYGNGLGSGGGTWAYNPWVGMLPMCLAAASFPALTDSVITARQRYAICTRSVRNTTGVVPTASAGEPG